MAGELPDWGHERRRLPAHLMAEAAANPGGSVAEIDGIMVTNPDGYVPLEAIIGFYVIGPDGRATGEYLRNPNRGPVRDDFSRLDSPDRWLGWLPGEPAAANRAQLQELLAGQVAGSVVEWVKVIDEPAFLATAVKPSADLDPADRAARCRGGAVCARRAAPGRTAGDPHRRPDLGNCWTGTVDATASGST
jgi:hypothetical protein